MKKNNKWLSIFMLFLVFFGIAICLYPLVSDNLNTIINQYQVTYYLNKTEKENKKKTEQMDQYNKQLAEKNTIGVMDPFESEKSGKSKSFEKYLIGSIIIPKIRVNVPVYDRTNDVLLQAGATLLDGTSFPIGGNSTHAVVSAHRGLSDKQFFTQLPELKKEDIFILHILDKKLAYKVDKIKVVEPSDRDWLTIEPGKDLVTLMTCTPYMVNSHRLLVQGHRVPYTKSVKKQEVKSHKDRKLIQIGLAIIILVLVILFIRSFLKISRRKKTGG